ncbi:MAG: DNA mismatch endonuclease Vsr [Planctomycetota bacterium]
MDHLSPEARSALMRGIRRRDTRPEVTLRKLLHGLGYRYRICRPDLPGTPDLTFPSRRAVIFVHGCFWHRHSCRRGRSVPRTNRTEWLAKFQRNICRDRRNRIQLRKCGWRVLVVWECQLRASKLPATIPRVIAFLEARAA